MTPNNSRCAPIDGPLPEMKNLTSENITDNVVILNSQCKDTRTRYIFERLVSHLHDFARETRLTSQEWQLGLEFLTKVGQISDDLRAEMILLSDTLGLSLLVDAINNPRIDKATEGTVLGPFHTHDAPVAQNGYVLHREAEERLFVLSEIRNTAGEPLSGVQCDVWEGDSYGFYDIQDEDRQIPNGRAVLQSDEDGIFYFMGVVPVPYPIPGDGPVGAMLQWLGRHPNRPGHVHFMLAKEGYSKLTTALYPRGDPYESSDPVLGVKDSLIVDLTEVDTATAAKYEVEAGMKMLKHTFVMANKAESHAAREKESKLAAERLGLDLQTLHELMPDVD